MAIQRHHDFHGLEFPLRQFGGARAVRVVHPGAQRIAEHSHDWPIITVAILGGYDEESGEDALSLTGATVSLHPAGHCHANCIHARGMETFSLEFDPAWLGQGGTRHRINRSHYWTVGPVLFSARRLSASWQRLADERSLAAATGRFVTEALHAPPVIVPSWLDEANRLAGTKHRSTTDIARLLDLNPAWLASAYRKATGIGLGEHLRKQRIEAAVHMLRATDEPIAAIAAEAGFCDQSHLNRSLRALTGRTPLQIRGERTQLAAYVVA